MIREGTLPAATRRELKMTTFEHKDRAKAAQGRPMPDNFSHWVERKTLADLVLETVRRTEGDSLKPIAPAGAGTAFRPHILLAVVTYCYAVGIYGSQDIENLMREDNAFRFLCGNEFPDWRVIRSFRRHNREAIYRSLAATFRAAWSLKTQRRKPSGTGPNQCESRTGANRVAALSPEQISDEAEERIERAMFIDSMAQDERTCE